MKKLREYQDRCVHDVLSSDKDIIICLPTGAGKTVIASALLNELEGIKVFIVPRLELIEQAHKEFGDVDIIWSDKTSLTGKDIIISSKDSLRTQYKNLPEGDVTLIFDECHIGIKQTKSLVDKIGPVRVLGLTATPERMDGYALLKGSDNIHQYGVFDEVLRAETVPSLIRAGYLSPLKYYAKPIEGITKIKAKNANGDELSGEQMMEIFNENQIWGDLVASYEKYGKGKPTVGFTTTVAMADVVCNIFNEAGYNFKTIHGEMSVKERQSLIKALETNEVDGLVNAALLTYGFDCPKVAYAFSCRHIKSRPLWFQMVGRILRIAPGKDEAVFVDHGDSISEFAEPDCALPIMDELIYWRADGENKEQKEARKKKIKTNQEVMQFIQEFDPLPVNMVEITMENTHERLLRIMLRMKKEHADIMKKMNSLQDYTLRQEEQLLEQENQKKALQKENNLLKKDKAKIKKEKEMLENGAAVTLKKMDADKTFELIRKNYCVRRRHYDTLGESDTSSHLKTRQSFLDDEKEGRLDFIIDPFQFEKGMEYWKTHYKPDNTWKKEENVESSEADSTNKTDKTDKVAKTDENKEQLQIGEVLRLYDEVLLEDSNLVKNSNGRVIKGSTNKTKNMVISAIEFTLDYYREDYGFPKYFAIHEFITDWMNNYSNAELILIACVKSYIKHQKIVPLYVKRFIEVSLNKTEPID